MVKVFCIVTFFYYKEQLKLVSTKLIDLLISYSLIISSLLNLSSSVLLFTSTPQLHHGSMLLLTLCKMQDSYCQPFHMCMSNSKYFLSSEIR